MDKNYLTPTEYEDLYRHERTCSCPQCSGEPEEDPEALAREDFLDDLRLMEEERANERDEQWLYYCD